MKKYAIIVLLPISMFFAYFGYTQWDKLYFSRLGDLMFEGRSNLNVIVLESQVKPETNGVLVPLGTTTTSGQVTEVVVEYTIMLASKVDSPKELRVDVYNITINSVPNPSNVVSVEVVAPPVIFNSAVTTEITISINMQNLQLDEYFDVMSQLKGGNINYNVAFYAL